MTWLIEPGARRGEVRAPASKSQAHRYLICAALTGHTVRVENAGSSQDIRATLACLSALLYADGGTRRLDCGESGTTLRFMLPLAGALGADAELILRGRLPERPIEPLARELRAHGMRIERQENILRCSGALRPGGFHAAGGCVVPVHIGAADGAADAPGGQHTEHNGTAPVRTLCRHDA